MKYLSIVAILFGMMASSFVWAPENKDEDGIQFENITFEEALALAKKENKLVFMDAYAVWCGPCKMLAKTTFKAKEVGEKFNKSFINIQVDMEKGEGPALARRYQVRAYPTLFVIHPDGTVAKRIVGFRGEKQLLSEVNEFLK